VHSLILEISKGVVPAEITSNGRGPNRHASSDGNADVPTEIVSDGQRAELD